jgi:hypothetical protein
MTIALTKDALEKILNREVEEIHLTVAKSIVLGMDADSIASALGVTVDEIKELQEDPHYKDIRLLVGAEHQQQKVERDSGWDGIEHAALNKLGQRVHREQDTDTLLRIAAVANRATRRSAPPKESVLDPSQVGHRVPLTLTRRYTEKLNGEGQAIERTETQQISVLNGSAVNPSFKEVSQLLQPKAEPRTQATVIERSQAEEDEPFSLDALKKLVRSQQDGR